MPLRGAAPRRTESRCGMKRPAWAKEWFASQGLGERGKGFGPFAAAAVDPLTAAISQPTGARVLGAMEHAEARRWPD